MADYDFAKIEKKLSKYLDEDRFFSIFAKS